MYIIAGPQLSTFCTSMSARGAVQAAAAEVLVSMQPSAPAHPDVNSGVQHAAWPKQHCLRAAHGASHLLTRGGVVLDLVLDLVPVPHAVAVADDLGGVRASAEVLDLLLQSSRAAQQC